ncbi:synthesizing protein 4 [Seminavis robusta]|uniref:[phosphatase 2A protein]-leucine-carboxy methyltransferase n=1 Tax=Seminavis robusta TaxID=568900 RepID=A0A9N8HLD8_9STRA|nr:synthesizing protein 4 [Seminavis robusta]|eukprot:Sro1022_g232350.1 synthesizing protein 4 (632) ;mRNA; f:13540-15435
MTSDKKPLETTSSSITRTALDALSSKWSAIVVGYKPMPQNGSLYENLMERMMNLPTTHQHQENYSKQPPRQSPLVSAGYAMRIASIAHVVHSFVSFHHQSKQQQPVNIVFLGCGMDVLGLWASSLAEEKTTISIWELDVPEIALAKKSRLLQGKFVKEEESHDNGNESDDSLVLKGHILQTAPVQQIDNNNYHLLGADLRDLSSLDNTLGRAMKAAHSNERPTLVVFELVLAYLEPENTDQVLQWCADNLVSGPGSALVAFESLGPTANDQQSSEIKTYSTTVPSVVRAYQMHYTRQFQAKLEKGRSTTTNHKQQPSMFHPLGSSADTVEQRLCGFFSKAHACTAATAAQWAAWEHPNTVHLTVPPGELFDEHAALSLHLASYTLVVAMKNDTVATLEQFQVQQRLCPWYYQGWTKKVDNHNNNDSATCCYVTIIEQEDEANVRTIFEDTYKELSQQHSAVRKMVKSALKQELAQSTRPRHSSSSIRQWYQRNGGDFFVAVQYRRQQGCEEREVVGGIGVRRWKSGDEHGSTFEIHRFFVETTCRRQGIGKSLLQMAESFVEDYRVSGRASSKYRVQATTLANLEQANHFYPTHGYKLAKEETIGPLTLMTYSKAFPAGRVVLPTEKNKDL